MSLFHAKCLCGPRVSTAVNLTRDAASRVVASRKRGRADPTGTAHISGSWKRDLDRRWRALAAMVPDAVAVRVNPVSMISHSMITGQDPIRAFQGWLDEALRQVILGVNGSWLLPYVRRATDAGALHARSTTDNVPPTSQVVDRTNILQSLSVTELQGIMEAVSQQAIRVFGDGVMTKTSLSVTSRLIRQVINSVGVRRGHLLANFMTVRAFNSAALDGYRAAGVKRVGTVPEVAPRSIVTKDAKLVEVLTAGDDNVCPQCEDISDEGPYTLSEAEDLIPAHPDCRCAFVPAGDERFGKVRDQATHVAAGVMIVAENTGRILLLKRAGGATDHVGEWAFPAGAVEPGETFEGTAARETREETGYDIDPAALTLLHRQDFNGVDFSTYLHGSDVEFRPRLNGEHSSHTWATINDLPSPLHPGVARTLSLTLGDEWKEELHPRDPGGKFTESGGGSVSKGDTTVAASKLMADLKKLHPGADNFEAQDLGNGKYQVSARYVGQWVNPPGKEHEEDYDWQVPTKETQTAVKAFADKFAAEHNVNVEVHSGEKNYTYFDITPKTSIYGGLGDPIKAPESKTPVKEAHPLEKHLANVQGTGAERKAMRLQMKGLKWNDPQLINLQHQHNASLWKQVQKLQKSDADSKKALKFANRLDKFSKSYGIPNPIKTSTSPITGPTVTKVAPIAPAPVQSIIAPNALDVSTLKKVGEQKGSNPGGVYESASGQKYYIKSMDKAHADNERLASKLYALTGAKTLEYVDTKPNGDTHYIATKLENLDKNNVSQLSATERVTAQKDFATHAWLANWDAAGLGGDNQGVKDGVVKTLDVGGALNYRAKGGAKGEAFGNKVGELETLRDPNKNPDAAKLFGSMTNEQIKESVDRVKNVSTAQIHSLVMSSGIANADELSAKLQARRVDLIKRASNLGKVEIPLAPTHPDFSTMSEEDQRVYWFKKTVGSYADTQLKNAKEMIDQNPKKLGGMSPAEVAFIRSFTGSESKVNQNLRAGIMDEHEFAFKHIMNDALAKMEPYKGNVVYRKIKLADSKKELYTPGKVVHWAQFSSTSKNPDTWSGNTHFTIRNPKSGVDVQSISSHPHEAEVIMPADTYYKVISKKDVSGITHIELEELTPMKKKLAHAT